MIVATEPDRSSLVVPAVAGVALAGGLLLRHLWGKPSPARDRTIDPSLALDQPSALDLDRSADQPDDHPDRDRADLDPREQRAAVDTQASAVEANPAEASPLRWIVPVPRWQGRDPVVSDGWGSPRDGGRRRHRGVDLMFRRRTARELELVFPRAAPHSKWHFMPPGTLVLAASDATVWSASRTPRGHAVVLSHGTPWATYYGHLSRRFVAETARGASRERVRAGQPIGIVGADPTDRRGIAHLHFEVWHRGGAEAAIDPSPLLRRWQVVDAPPTPTEVS